MIELDDCGREMQRTYTLYGASKTGTVCMVVKAPRGILLLYQDGDTKKQCKVIKAFMRKYKND